MLEINVAVQSNANADCEKGAQLDLEIDCLFISVLLVRPC